MSRQWVIQKRRRGHYPRERRMRARSEKVEAGFAPDRALIL
jgi:hypothetical protein